MNWRALRPYLTAASVVVLLVVAGVLALSHSEAPVGGSPQVSGSPTLDAAPTPESSTAQSPAPTKDPVATEIDRLRAAARVAPGPPGRRITGDFSQQPDLYAAEFVRRLLTQDYRTSRAEHLAWVQSEAAQTSEPLVVGLVPKELRDHLAVYSVTDAAGQTRAVPVRNAWTALGLQDAYTTVRIERVTEPMAWSTAVSSGRISDPGITGREVAASVTLHYRKQGKAVTSTSSVAMTLNIEGPPTRGSWGFVCAVTYSSLAVSAS